MPGAARATAPRPSAGFDRRARPAAPRRDRPAASAPSATRTVVYGLGLHSGQRTGMVLQPLPENSGIHFVTLPTGVEIPAHVRAVAETDYATTLSGEGESIRTVEHLLSALHAYGVGNLLIKVHGEIPVLDGSALEFCRILEEVGIAEQDEPQREVVDRPPLRGARRGREGAGDRAGGRVLGLLPPALSAAGGRAVLRVHPRPRPRPTSGRSPRPAPSAS